MRQLAGIEPRRQGLFVAHVKEVSAAADAGLRDGDIITQVNGRTVTSTDEFGRLVEAAKGDYLRLYVFRPQAQGLVLRPGEDRLISAGSPGNGSAPASGGRVRFSGRKGRGPRLRIAWRSKWRGRVPRL